MPMKGNLTVYKASAGSGKTFTLTAEYIAMLLGCEAPSHRHILAVTFTNKATAEMKERIIDELCAMASSAGRSPSGFMRKVMELLPGIDAAELCRRAHTALRAILHDYDNFRVQTIDAFFQSLLGALAHDLGLSAGLKVDINDREVINGAVERLLTALAARPQVRRWVLDYVRERIDDNRRWDVSKEINALAYNLTDETFMRNEETLLPVLGSESALREYKRELTRLSADITAKMKEAAATLDSIVRDSGGGYADFSYGSSLESYVAAVMNNPPGEAPKANVVKKMAAAENWLRAADRKRPPLMERAEQLRGLLLALEDIRSAGATTVNSCRLCLQHLNPLRLLGEIRREVQDINAENNRFMLAATPLLFNRLVGRDDASFVFERAGTQFRHVMIDEFQDTSNLQWSNFRNLLVENMAQGNSCLLVGDVKQSIYRWRGGDWRILESIGSDLRQGPVDIRTLDHNFRSSRCIVEFNNALFPRVAELLDGIAGTERIRAIYADTVQQCCGKEGGEVRVYLADALCPAAAGDDMTDTPDGETVAAPALADEIYRLHEDGVAYGDMAILVRRKREGVAILDFFAEEFPDIPVVSDEAFLLSGSPAVEMMVHALRYMQDPTDTISLAYVAKIRCQQAGDKVTDWEKVTRHGVASLPEKLAEEREKLLAMPLYELCEALVRLLEVDKLENAAPYVLCFLDAVLEFIDNGGTELSQLLVYWDETLCQRAIPAGELAGIRILTIHKSKGLAFHTVFVPYCDWTVERDRNDDILWCNPSAQPYNQLPLVPVSVNSTMRQSVFAGQYEEEHLSRRIENLNMMYVAFTRARRNLLVWGVPGKTGGLKSMADLLAQCDACALADEASDAAVPAPDEPEKPSEIVSEAVALRSYESRVAFRQSNDAQQFIGNENEASDASERRQEQYIDNGKLFHHLFSMIATKDDLDDAIAALQFRGLLPEKADAGKIRAWILRRLEAPGPASWFDGTWKLFNEQDILSRRSDGTLAVHRPDRVMTRGDETVVVDFKFGKCHERYVTQVRDYCALLRDMGHANVRGYLWFVYTGEIKEVSLNDLFQ